MSSNVNTSGAPLPVAPSTDERLPLPGGADGEVGTQGPTGPQSASGTQGATAPRPTGAPFGSDETIRNQGPNRLSGGVGNATPYDSDFGALKQTFDQNGVAVPTEAQLRNLQAVGGDSQPVRELVDGVKSNIRTGSALPTMQNYQSAHASMADQLRQDQQAFNNQFTQNMVTKIGDAGKSDDEKIAAKIADPAALVMFVMLKSKSELTAEKKDDLNQIKKYSTINDLMNKYMNDVLLPKQQELSDVTNKMKDKDKATKQTVEMPNVQNPNLDNYGKDDDGNPVLLHDTGVDKHGAAGPETRKVNQQQLSSEISNFQNQLQQVSSRMQREQTNYSGHDSQDSTLSNIITATNKTFADARSAIINNMK